MSETLHHRLSFSLVLVTYSCQWQRVLCSAFLQKGKRISKLSIFLNVKYSSKFLHAIQENLERFLGEFLSHLRVHCSQASAMKGTCKLIRINKIFATIGIQRKENREIDFQTYKNNKIFHMNGNIIMPQIERQALVSRTGNANLL